MGQLRRSRRCGKHELLAARQTAIHQMHKRFFHARRQMLHILDNQQIRLPGRFQFFAVAVGKKQRLEISRREQCHLQIRRALR